jgi:hypothetical protein
MSALMQPMMLVCSELLAMTNAVVTASMVSNSAGSPWYSMNFSTKLCADVRSAVLSASQSAVCCSILSWKSLCFGESSVVMRSWDVISRSLST